MSGVIKSNIQDTYGRSGTKGAYIQWSKVHPWATSYLDLWLSPLDGGFGPVAKEVLAKSSQTKLMVLELAQAPNMERDLQAGCFFVAGTCSRCNQHDTTLYKLPSHGENFSPFQKEAASAATESLPA